MRYDLGRFHRPMRSCAELQAMSMAFPGGTKVFGSIRPTQFLNDVASGKDSLDVLLLGDSNTGSAIHDFWGYHNGFCEAMNARGWTYYGTPLFAAMNGRNVNNAPSSWRGSINYFAPSGSLLSGNSSGGATAYSVWSPTGNWTRYGSSSTTPDSRDDWAYISSATQYFTTFGLQIASDNPLAVAGNTIYYRLRYGTFTAGGGGFCPMVFNGANAEQFSPRQFQSSTGASYSYNAWEKSWVTSGTTSYRGTWAFVAGSDVCKGPMAIANQSFYRRSKGWSITSHAYLGGFSSDAIASIIVNSVPSTLLKNHLQELRERQILAGGTGRVLVAFQFGVNATASPANLPETPAKWVQAARDIWTTYKTAWSALGYPSDDLACLCWCSHQTNVNDNSSQGTGGNMVAVRTAANQMALDYPDMTVVDVKQLLPYSKLIMGTGPFGSSGDPDLVMYGLPYYQRIDGWPNAGINFYEHLSGGQISAGVNHPTDGYRVMSEAIISAVLSR